MRHVKALVNSIRRILFIFMGQSDDDLDLEI